MENNKETEEKKPFPIGLEPNVMIRCPKCGGGMLKTKYHQEFAKESIDIVQCVVCGHKL